MRTNSPIDDPAPFEMPQFEEMEDVVTPTEADPLDRQGLLDYIDARVEYFDRYLPNGEAVLDKKPEELGVWWQAAATLKAEFRALSDQIKKTKKK